jgi:hypothetical protein
MGSLKKIVAASLIALVFFSVRRVYGQGNEESLPLSEPQKNEVQDSEELRDPFRSYMPAEEILAPGQEQAAAPVETSRDETFDYSSLSVTGLVWGTDKAKAIINGNIYSKGDIVNEAQILEINKEGILFKYKSKEYLMKRNL